MTFLIGEDLWKYLESKGQTRHEHKNGLFSCHECSMVVATGKTKQELDQEWKEICDRIGRDLGILK